MRYASVSAQANSCATPGEIHFMFAPESGNSRMSRSRPGALASLSNDPVASPLLSAGIAHRTFAKKLEDLALHLGSFRPKLNQVTSPLDPMKGDARNASGHGFRF